MAVPLEDYALIGDTQTAALVSRHGSIDWLCFPRFDSGACFAALLGDERHGYWSLRPAGDIVKAERRYRDRTLVLETDLTTDSGTVRITDFMPVRDRAPDVVRVVECLSGRVSMRMDLVIRFDYGSIVPWVRRQNGRLLAVAGPDALCLATPVRTHGENMTTVAEFEMTRGDVVPFVLTWFPSHDPSPKPVDAFAALDDTDAWWREWADRCTMTGEWRDVALRSLITLKALTYAPTGGIVAAPTTSLPEKLGGVRNWDYRFCWLRDATFTLYSLMMAGYQEEAEAWRDWLLRAVAGSPEQMQIMYGTGGERRLTELELAWLPGYEGSRPVRVGNAAANQFQLDVYGEVMDSLHQARNIGISSSTYAWSLQRSLMEFLESNWKEPDEGIWEIRGPRRHFTHSKVMAWVAFDRAVGAVEHLGLDGPLGRWRSIRDTIHAEVCREAYDPDRRTFTQSYGSKQLDASLLIMALVGFLPADDVRIEGTVAAVQRELSDDGLIQRYSTDGQAVDGLPPGEGVFLPCSFWMADNLALAGRKRAATTLYRRLVGLANDVGLLSEELDTTTGRLVGNFPQAFTHVALVNTAHNLSHPHGPARHRRRR